MKYPKISIVIPSYNKRDYIAQTLQSIVDQKYPNLEVIIQDGGSSDGTLEIIKKYAKKYPKIFSWESKKDKGQLDALNKGLKKTKGEILTFINADDVYEEGALMTIAESFPSDSEILWLVGRGRTVDKEGREIARVVTVYKNFLLKLNKYFLLFCVNYLFQPSVFISKIAYEKYGPFLGDKTSVMEYGVWLKLAKVSMPKIVDKTLSSFRLYSGGLSLSKNREILEKEYKLVSGFTTNPLILFIHKLNNLGRIILSKLLHKNSRKRLVIKLLTGFVVLGVLFVRGTSLIYSVEPFWGTLAPIFNHPFVTYEEKMRMAYPGYYDLMMMIKKETPENSVIYVPDVAIAYGEAFWAVDNITITTAFLYPRYVLPQSQGIKKFDCCKSYALFVAGRPEFEVGSHEIIIFEGKDIKVVNGNYRPKNYSSSEMGLIEI